MIQDNIEFNSVKTSHGTELGSGPIGMRLILTGMVHN